MLKTKYWKLVVNTVTSTVKTIQKETNNVIYNSSPSFMHFCNHRFHLTPSWRCFKIYLKYHRAQQITLQVEFPRLLQKICNVVVLSHTPPRSVDSCLLFSIFRRLPHSLHSDKVGICLFTKDKNHSEMKVMLKENDVPVNKVWKFCVM